MPLPQANSASSETDQKLLRFGCPACGVRLVVDQAIAGKKGPCPACGANIVAPPIEVGRDLIPRQASPVVVKPRRAPAAVTEDSSERETAPVTPASEAIYTPSKRRSVSPNTAISHRHKESVNTLVFFKILAAILVVALIVAAVFLVLRQGA